MYRFKGGIDMLLGALSINCLFSLAVLLDTHSRNQKAYNHLSSVGYDIKPNKKLTKWQKFTKFCHDYLICFIPVLNLISFFKNASMSNGEYRNKRLDYYKEKDMVTENKYEEEIKEVNAKDNELFHELQTHGTGMTLEEERKYYKDMFEKLSEDYNKLVKLGDEESAKKVKETLDLTSEYYFAILDELNLDELKYSDNKSTQRILKK